jgi:hypothetical protein
LDVAGAPRVSGELVSEIVLMTGTMWHEWIHNTLRRLGVPYMAEVNLTPWLPKGWGGTADAVIWHPDLKAFVLADFKTTKGESIRYILRDGAKDDHVGQTSLYWHGLKKMGLPLAKAIGVYYLPKNDTRSKGDVIEPVLVDFEPLPKAKLARETKMRFARLNEYEESLPFVPPSVLAREGEEIVTPSVEVGEWLTDALEPEQARTQRIHFVRRTESYDVKLAPHWSAAYCPFPDELCSCSAQGEEKIGYYDPDGNYVPRKGYEDIEPLVAPA